MLKYFNFFAQNVHCALIVRRNKVPFSRAMGKVELMNERSNFLQAKKQKKNLRERQEYGKST